MAAFLLVCSRPSFSAIGKLNFFEGGVRPACFIASPLLTKLRSSTTGSSGGEGAVYTGILHTTDWFATFAALAGASLPSPDDPSLAISGEENVLFEPFIYI